MKILIMEDDADLGDFIRKGLYADGHIVDRVFDGHEGSYIARTNPYDLIIIDYSLPKKNGLIACSEIRAFGSTASIIFLSATSDPRIKISAFENGADDYVTKPFSFDELKARIKAIARRPQKIENPTLRLGELTLDTEKQVVYRNGITVFLTRKEYNLLEYLMKNPGSIVSRGMIMEHVWNVESDPFSNTVEAHILNLRRKVNAGNQRDIIRNIPGRGYIIDA